MTIRNLDGLFNPRSIALIGASKRAGSLGSVLARNLFNGGFEGPIMPLHRKHEAIEGVLAYPSVAALPMTPDLAVIATPPDSVPGLIAELGARGTRGAVVITAGFGEGNDEAGAGRRAAMLQAARPHLLRIVGPNGLGVMVPGVGLNAGFAHLSAKTGDLALVTQSGAIVTAILDWASPRGIGFSHIVSLGDMSDVDFGDMLDYLATDPKTRAILLYVEAVTQARKFMSAARAAARAKPVIVIKGGRHEAAAKAAASHTGALAGSDATYDAAFARAGMLRVETLEELFDAAETLGTLGRNHRQHSMGERLAILTNGGGMGVLAADALIEGGGRLADLTPQTLEGLDAVLPPTWSGANPVDIIGDAPGERYAAALLPLLEDPNCDAVLVLNCPTAVASSTEAAEAVVQTLEGHQPHRPIFTAWLGDPGPRAARRLFGEHGLPTHDTPEQAVRAFLHLVHYRRHQELLREIPPSEPGDFQPDGKAARRLLDDAADEGRAWLNEVEAKALLAAYDIPVVAGRTVATVADVGSAATAIGLPVAVKVLSPDVLHKSDVGGVALDLETAEAAEAAARAMQARLAEINPGARLEGFVVQQMCRRPDAHELILGIVEDRQFGPVLLFGQGGTAVEVVDDKSLALPPLNLALARHLMERTRVFDLLRGYRDRPAAALDSIALTLVKLSHLVADLAEVAELDINPLLADAQGVVALDARVRLRPVSDAERRDPAARLAIRPYPKHLEARVELPDGTSIHTRPIRPDDAPMLQRAFHNLSPHDIRMRFFASLSDLGEDLAKRLTQIDYEREMALLAVPLHDHTEVEADGVGVVRLMCDPDQRQAEFAVTVLSSEQGRGLGRALMMRIIDYARRRGVGEVWGLVLRENTAMLRLAESLGFQIGPSDDGPGAVRVSLDLRSSAT